MAECERLQRPEKAAAVKKKRRRNPVPAQPGIANYTSPLPHDSHIERNVQTNRRDLNKKKKNFFAMHVKIQQNRKSYLRFFSVGKKKMLICPTNRSGAKLQVRIICPRKAPRINRRVAGHSCDSSPTCLDSQLTFETLN